MSSYHENNNVDHQDQQESYPRLLDIDSSLEKINKVEQSSSHAKSFNQDREHLSDINKNFEVSLKTSFFKSLIFKDRFPSF